jgi:hypothetical protein
VQGSTAWSARRQHELVPGVGRRGSPARFCRRCPHRASDEQGTCQARCSSPSRTLGLELRSTRHRGFPLSRSP